MTGALIRLPSRFTWTGVCFRYSSDQSKLSRAVLAQDDRSFPFEELLNDFAEVPPTPPAHLQRRLRRAQLLEVPSRGM